MLTQTLSSLNSIFAECQEFLVEQAKWNVLLTVHNALWVLSGYPLYFTMMLQCDWSSLLTMTVRLWGASLGSI